MEFLTTTNFGYIDFARNLCAQFQSAFMTGHRLTVECLDADSREAIAGLNYPNVRAAQSTVAVSSFAAWGTPEFRQVVNSRFGIVAQWLRECERLWYLDCDLAIFADPAPYANAEAGVLFQSDNARADRFPHACKLCSGNFVVRNTPETVAMMEAILQMNVRFPAKTNQWHLNRWIRERGGGADVRLVARPAVGVLPARQFPNGALAGGKRGWWRGSVIAHANYVRGPNSKKELLQKWGRWLQ